MVGRILTKRETTTVSLKHHNHPYLFIQGLGKERAQVKRESELEVYYQCLRYMKN